jgi:TolA-binding protein
VVINYPGSEEAKLAMRDLKSLYVETNRVDEYAKLITEMPGNIRFEVNEQDSLTYIAAEKVYMRADNKQAKQSFERYLQSYPQGAFSLNAHYYLALMAKTANNDAELLEHTAKLLEYPDSPFSEEALVMQAETLSKQKRHEEALATYKKLQAKASTIERKRMGLIGALLSASQLNNSIETIHAATSILAEEKISPEIKNEARYLRSMAYLQEQANEKAFADWQELAKDLRTVYGAEAKYRLSQMLFDDEEYAAAEQQVLQFIDQSTPHAYWLARAFVLLSDVYAAQGKNIEARQYLLSLKQNYQADDDIAGMIEERLATITEE